MPSDRLKTIVPAIHQEYFAFYWQHKRLGTEQALDLLPGTLQALVKGNFFVTVEEQTLPVLDFLLQCVQPWQKTDLRRDAIKTLGGMATEEVLNVLCIVLNNENCNVCYDAAEALGAMGAKAATPEVLDALCATLLNEDKYLGEAAAEALGAMGAKVAEHPGVLDALLTVLWNQYGFENYDAEKALSAMGVKAATPDMLHTLCTALQDMKENVRRVAARTLGKMREKAATPEVLDALLTALKDENWYVRSDAAKALSTLGAKATAYPGVLDALLTTLNDWHKTVRSDAAEALWNMQKWRRHWKEALRVFMPKEDGKDYTILRIGDLTQGKRPGKFQPRQPEEPQYVIDLRAKAAVGDRLAQALLLQAEAWLHQNAHSDDAEAL